MSGTRHLPRPPFAANKAGDFATLMALRRNPLELWGEAAYREEVLEGSFFGRPHFLVSGVDAIQRVLVANVGNYVRDIATRRMMHPVFGEGLFLAEGDAWRRQRRMIAPAMAPRALTLLARHVALETAITEATLADGAGSPVELLPIMQELALGIAGRSMFSLEMAQRGAELRRLLVQFRETLSQPTAADLLLRPTDEPNPAERRRAVFRDEWTGFIDALIAERDPAARPEGAPRDLLDMLSDARDGETGEALDPAMLRDEVATMILAGHETTAVTLFWSCFLFARFPDWQEELAREASPLDLAPAGAAAAIPSLPRLRSHVDETLRLYPPAFAITREALGCDELGGQTIPAGAMITISPFVVNRHESHWHDPDLFDPGRFTGANPPARYTYLPFGAGPRVCIGATFALTEVVVALGRLLQRFRIELAPGHSEVLPRGSVTTHPDRKVMFVLHPRD